MSLVQNRLTRGLEPLLSGSKTVHATVLLAGLIGHYGLELLEWDPITVAAEIEDDFDLRLPTPVFDKIMAGISAITGDTVYTVPSVFHQVVMSFGGEGVGEDDDAPSVDDLALTVAQLYLLDPEPELTEREHQRWGHEIRKYARAVLDSEGFTISPAVLDFVPDRRPNVGVSDEPDTAMVAGSFNEQRAKAREIDQMVEREVEQIVADLLELGIDPNAN